MPTSATRRSTHPGSQLLTFRNLHTLSLAPHAGQARVLLEGTLTRSIHMQQERPERKEDKRRSPILEMAMLFAECLQHGLRTIAFCKTRKMCELVTSYTRDVLSETAPAFASRLAVYRCASCGAVVFCCFGFFSARHIPASGTRV